MSGNESTQNPHGLPAWLQMTLIPEVKNLWFDKKELHLDGYRFISCRFDKCRLIVNSVNFEILDCFISEDTVLIFGNEVVKPIRLFNRSYPWIYEKIPYFAPVRTQDGKISVRTW